MSEMDNGKDFYVGYHERAPKRISSFIRRTLLVMALVAVAVAVLLVLYQRGFSNSRFELGQLSEVTGVLKDRPVPMLKVCNGVGPDGRIICKNIILINYGKFGADGLLVNYKERMGKPLEDMVVTISGTLIYRDGVTLMELTKKEDALVSFDERKSMEHDTIAPNLAEQRGTVRLKGEILDPKCYFGAMKPGFGKAHRSCAIRCISGGIPPVLKVTRDNGEVNYYLLRGQDGESINLAVLEFVADPVQIEGRLELHDEWMVLYLDPSSGIQRY